MAPISQSDTRWVKKPGKAGYVEQISTGKRVTGKIALSTTIGSGNKTINNIRGVADYSKGRNVTKPLYKMGKDDSPKKSPPATKNAPDRSGVNTFNNMTDRERNNRIVAKGSGLRLKPSERGKYSGSKKKIDDNPKPAPASTPKRPLTPSERAKQTGGVNAYGMMGGAEGTVRSTTNKSKDGVFSSAFRRSASPAESAAAQAKADAAAKSRRSTDDRLRTAVTKEMANRRARVAAANKLADEKKKSSADKIGDTKSVSAGVGYVQTQKYTKNGWVNVGPKRKSR